MIKKIHFISLDTVDSTNEWIKRNFSSFPENEITCVTALEQTGGKGRFAKKWISPKEENLYASLYFTVENDFPYLQNMGQVLAISCAKILHALSVPAKIKWPNDILVHQKKISGILVETLPFKEKKGVIVGIGLNVNMTKETLDSISPPATSLKEETKKTWDVHKVLLLLLEIFVQDLQELRENGFADFAVFYTEHLSMKEELISVTYGGKVIHGICKKISPQGKLLLLDEKHQWIEISTGELIQEGFLKNT